MVIRENSYMSDRDLVVNIGGGIGMSIGGESGSYALVVTVTGFPTSAQTLGFGISIDGVTTTTNINAGTTTVSGSVVADHLAVLDSLEVALADDDDENFTLMISGTVTGISGAGFPVDVPFSLPYAVIVQAVADTPIVDVGATNKTTVEENSPDFVTYPVIVRLNDTDGSETYESIVIELSTSGDGTLPDVRFGSVNGFTRTDAPGQVTLTGTPSVLEVALLALQVRPGLDNGGDISVTVTATSVESNPSEAQVGGAGVVGSEISVPTAVASDSFLIPVKTEAVPLVVVLESVDGPGDTQFPLGGINIPNAGGLDPDASQELFL
jgi:hypothetical protein